MKGESYKGWFIGAAIFSVVITFALQHSAGENQELRRELALRESREVTKILFGSPYIPECSVVVEATSADFMNRLGIYRWNTYCEEAYLEKTDLVVSSMMPR